MLNVFEISRMTKHNGPGIRTLVHFKGCPLHCIWCSTPESQKREQEFFFKPMRCIGCGACAAACADHKAAISFIPGEKPVIDREKCDNCFKCVSECHSLALSKVGKDWTVDELLHEICKDEVFFSFSGGGITFSGGEPLMGVTDEYVELYRKIKEKGISIGVDTTGYVPWENIERLLPYIDFFLWDLKFMDSALHKKFTGAENGLILENLKKVEEAAKVYNTKVYIRCVQIPGMTDTDENLIETCRFLKNMKCIEEIDLVNFHHYGLKRYEALGKKYEVEGLEPLSKSVLAEKQKIVENFGIPCRFDY